MKGLSKYQKRVVDYLIGLAIYAAIGITFFAFVGALAGAIAYGVFGAIIAIIINCSVSDAIISGAMVGAMPGAIIYAASYLIFDITPFAIKNSCRLRRNYKEQGIIIIKSG